MATETLQYTAENIDYLQHGDTPLRLRLLRPLGAGPFPLVVDLHGGAWTKGDLTECQNSPDLL